MSETPAIPGRGLPRMEGRDQMDMNADRVDRLDDQDWTLIMEAVERDHGLEDEPGRKARLAELAAALLRPSNRPLCSQCDGSPADRWLANGLCPMCHLSNELAAHLPEEFDGDESQESILERGIVEMAKIWEASKKLREQCEREEAGYSVKHPYLHTMEIRNLMGWGEQDSDGTFTRYHFTPEKGTET